MKRLLLSVFAVSVAATVALAQTKWQLNTEKEGIKVYTADFAGSKIKSLKVEATLEGNPGQLVALLMDVNTSAEWVYHLKSAKTIKQVSPSELYYYSEVNMPWPVANRDFVAHLTVTQNPITKVVVIDGPTVPGMTPERKGVVRVNQSIGRWVITPIDANHIKIQYTLHTEPGGTLPAWLVNMFATDGPIQMFRAMRARLQMPAYRNAVLSYIDNSNGVNSNLAATN